MNPDDATAADQRDDDLPASAEERERLAKLIGASLGEEEDFAGALSLPDAEEGAELPAPRDALADALDDGAEDSLSAQGGEATDAAEFSGEALGAAFSQALEGDDNALSTSDLAAEASAVPGWGADGQALLVDDDDDDEGLRSQVAAGIAGLAEAPEEEVTPGVIDLPPREIRAAVEALLLCATKPMSEERLAGCLPGSSLLYLRGLLEGLAARYRHEYRGWDLRRLAGGWQLLTRPELHPWVRQLDKTELPTRLSKSAMETLAIVAYKQPVARGDIEDIRGVQCGPMLRQLMDLKLVQVIGRNDDAIGRPMLYGTTAVFLNRFGLGSIGDLPRQHEFGG
ncbi:MAG: SMC-Scp complex subunit ScpB [Planctomycetota bacterium]|nr:MAG: SMC-Scp complex subunit ScpB [Planctomycetota bacterium]